MIKGAAIYGIALPVTEGFAEVISDEIEFFIKSFGYEDFTLSEIILAMYLNCAFSFRDLLAEGNMIEFTGSCFNVAFLSKILSLYRTLRAQMERKIQNQIDGY